MSESVVSKESRGSNPMRDNDTVSVASSDDFLLDSTGTFIRQDKHYKQKRRGSGLGNLANIFKANIKKVVRPHHDGHHGNEKGEGVPAQVTTESQPPQPDYSESSHHDHATTSQQSPQDFLNAMWRSRGYCRDFYNTLETGYSNKPSPLQVASYHPRLLEMVRSNSAEELQELLKLGVSQNPANENGESLLHLVCRLGNHALLSMLIDEYGADVQIADSNGRTPLHEACFGGATEPHFAVIDILAGKDKRMFSLKDKDGKTPLDCIPMEQWGSWIDFLYVRRDTHFPRRLVRVDGKEEAPPLVDEKPNSRSLADPPSALTIDFAGLVVSGEITLEAVKAQKKSSGDDEVEVVSTDDSSSTTNNPQ
mmetsp:Transcript_26617/g.62546  ORF Transcript_26617/g.62546 Transcript_26617/m.62546 type:complete len:365 (+) Transcript_26617:168-1262(+)